MPNALIVLDMCWSSSFLKARIRSMKPVLCASSFKFWVRDPGFLPNKSNTKKVGVDFDDDVWDAAIAATNVAATTGHLKVGMKQTS